MPVPALSGISGKDVDEIVDSLEKQRKELQFLLSSLDTTNIAELNAEVINAGIINAKHISIDSTTTFGPGYDPAVLRSEVTTQFQVIAGQIAAKVSQVDFDRLGNRVATNESTLTIHANQIQSKVSHTDYNGNTIASMINQTATTITIQANKINLLGITQVASTLYIGNSWRDNDSKAIWFRGLGGGVVISSETVDNLYLGCLGTLRISGGTLDLSQNYNINWGAHRPTAVWG